MAKFLKQYEIFFKKAHSDLNLAKYALNGFYNENLEIDLEIIFFHLQQCAEKLLKTLLDFNKIKFPKIHDIEELINICKNSNIDLIDNINKLSNLTDYAIEGRYATIHDDIEDVEEYIELLNNLTTFVKSIINNE